MNPIKIIQKYYPVDSLAYKILLNHGKAVSQKALKAAKKVAHLKPDLEFIKEAALLHDIGIFLTNAPDIGCFGSEPYIRHGYLGRKILEKEGLPKHALVCERHIGTGISIEDIKKQNLPLPQKDMLPISIEEQIISFADNFFSKNPKHLNKEHNIAKIRQGLAKFGEHKVKIFDEWLEIFGE